MRIAARNKRGPHPREESQIDNQRLLFQNLVPHNTGQTLQELQLLIAVDFQVIASQQGYFYASILGASTHLEPVLSMLAGPYSDA
jgi:hypothetical protein